jgi:hypothetical protein
MSTSNQDYGWLGQLALYATIAVGVIVALYYGITALATGGGQAFLNQYNKSLEDYINKLNGFSSQNNGVLTGAQTASKDFEEKQLQSLAGNAASAFSSVWNWLGDFVVAGTLAALAYGIFKNPDVVAKWTGIIKNALPKSPKAQCDILDCALVDELNAEGYTVEATNLLTSIQSTWTNVDAPYMQQQIQVLQEQVNAGILTGVELDLANYWIEAFTYELTMMPTILVLPLV